MIIGCLHLKPLPGSPEFEDFDEVLDHAIRNAKRLEEGGVDAIIIENFNDKPFLMEVGKETVAAMTAVAKDVRDAVSLPIGINVLRNDGIAAASIAKAVKADFIRVNQLFFPSIMPEGFSHPIAGKLARFIASIKLNAMVFADICAKHAVHFAGTEDYIENADRSFADAFVLTGETTGKPPKLSDVKFVAEKLRAPIIIGSGVTPENFEKFGKYAYAFIVGSYFKRGDEIDVERVRRLTSLKHRVFLSSQ